MAKHPEPYSHTVTLWRCHHPEHRHQSQNTALKCMTTISQAARKKAREELERVKELKARAKRRTRTQCSRERQITIVSLRNEGYNTSEIAARVGISKSAVYQRLKQANATAARREEIANGYRFKQPFSTYCSRQGARSINALLVALTSHPLNDPAVWSAWELQSPGGKPVGDEQANPAASARRNQESQQ